MLIPLIPHESTYTSGATRLSFSSHQTISRDEKVSRLLPFYSLPEEVDQSILKTAKGKPYFSSLPLCVSLTDSGPYDVLAISPEEIGIDLQIQGFRLQSAQVYGLSGGQPAPDESCPRKHQDSHRKHRDRSGGYFPLSVFPHTGFPPFLPDQYSAAGKTRLRCMFFIG